VPSICDAIGVPHTTVESPEAAADLVTRVGTRAFDSRMPAACLLPRRMTVPVTKL
jgi:sulfopyruvate decarboxylase TPP-binding subunit